MVADDLHSWEEHSPWVSEFKWPLVEKVDSESEEEEAEKEDEEDEEDDEKESEDNE